MISEDPKYSRIKISCGYAPDSAVGAYSTPPDLLAGGEGLAAASPRTPPRLSALWASLFESQGLADRRVGNPNDSGQEDEQVVMNSRFT